MGAPAMSTKRGGTSERAATLGTGDLAGAIVGSSFRCRRWLLS